MGQGGVRDEMRTVPCVTSEEKIKHTKNTSETCKYFICVCIYIYLITLLLLEQVRGLPQSDSEGEVTVQTVSPALMAETSLSVPR